MAIFHVVRLAILPLTILVMHSSAIEGYTHCGKSGWFGDHNCKYQCHCAGSADCDKVDGSCASGCDHGWFGPACQYAPMRYTAHTRQRGSLWWLTDNDVNTCNNRNTSSVLVDLATPIPLTWVRLVVKDSANLNEITVGYRQNGNDRTCSDQGKAKVNKNTVDVNCSTSHAVSEVSLTGRGVKNLCSLYVSGGRNLALMQHTVQSSTHGPWRANQAVDGKIDSPNSQTSQEDTCTHTAMYDGPGSWTLGFSVPVSVTRFLLYNRRYLGVPGTGCCEDVFTVVPAPRSNFASVRSIQISPRADNHSSSLCEVFVFGESACLPGKFGLECERQCNCANPTESCFVHSGGCPTGCAHGYTGEDCWTKIAEPLRDEGGGRSNIPVIVGSLITVLGILTIAAAVLLWRRTRAKSVSFVGQEGNSTVMFKVLRDER